MSSHSESIYISGKITGIEQSAPAIFAKAESFLFECGYKPINPMKLPHNHDKTWLAYMREDLAALILCDAIFMLSNWKESRGAKIEHNLALSLGLNIIYQNPELTIKTSNDEE